MRPGPQLFLFVGYNAVNYLYLPYIKQAINRGFWKLGGEAINRAINMGF